MLDFTNRLTPNGFQDTNNKLKQNTAESNNRILL